MPRRNARARLNPRPSAVPVKLPSLSAVCRSLGMTQSELEDRLLAGSRLVVVESPAGVSVSLR
jgi:hypothetical protein